MKTIILSLVIMVSGLFSNTLIAKTLDIAWQVEGFKMPESVVYDAERKRYYISNINQAPMKQDDNGSIGLIKEGGNEAIIEWITGLSSPKGLGLRGDKLYVADVKELIVIDVEKGEIAQRFSAPDTLLLNGIAVSGENIFVSDWMGNAIYTLEEQGLELWLKSPELESPNGLFVQGDYLYVGAWGNNPKADFTTETTGGLKRISLKTKNIETLTNGESWMNLDGLHAVHADKFLASDFIKGQILEIKGNGNVEGIYNVGKTSADFFYVREKNLIVVPFFMSNKVVAFKYLTDEDAL